MKSFYEFMEMMANDKEPNLPVLPSLGRYICEREGGHIAGSMPKKKKANPHAADGKKECLGCKQVLSFSEYGADKSRADGMPASAKSAGGLRLKRNTRGKKLILDH